MGLPWEIGGWSTAYGEEESNTSRHLEKDRVSVRGTPARRLSICDEGAWARLVNSSVL